MASRATANLKELSEFSRARPAFSRTAWRRKLDLPNWVQHESDPPFPSRKFKTMLNDRQLSSDGVTLDQS
jgi:hypothetical protein